MADHLEHLDLRANRLEILSDNALASMTSLRKLNLADNQLAALPPTLFSISTEMSMSPPHGAAFVLESLQLQNNSLTLLTPGLFAGLSQLSMLNLSHNAIASHLLDADSFKGLSNLKVIFLKSGNTNIIGPSHYYLVSFFLPLGFGFSKPITINYSKSIIS